MRWTDLAILAVFSLVNPRCGNNAKADDIHAVAVGGSGVIRQTFDGGGNWFPRTSGTTAHLNDVDCVGSQCWIVGSGGMVLHSADGGMTWTPQDSGSTQRLFSVDFVDTMNGWATGRESILHTNDGGKTWEQQVVAPVTHSVVFINQHVGWAAGSSGIIRHTVDGGENWSFQTSRSEFEIRAIDFVDENIGWFVVPGGPTTLGRTTNGGALWEVDHSASGVSLDFVDANHGWTVTTSLGGVMSTDDGGTEWTPQTTPTNTNLFDVMFIDQQIGWIVGNNGAVLHTIDGGTNWRSQAVGVSQALFAVSVDRQSGPDFDHDGDVDGEDFLDWQTGFGIQSGAHKTDGDSDCDGDVDGDDFLTWQEQFGSGNGSASATVPEPNILVLAAISIVAFRCMYFSAS